MAKVGAARRGNAGGPLHGLLSLLLALPLLAALGCGGADAKVIGILFDDSGSMKGKMHLPAFAAQLLVSSLDGRGDGDRLVTALMSDYDTPNPVVQQDIGSVEAQRRLIETIAGQWTVPREGTPFTQIGTLLERMRDLQRPGEEAYLTILTDGEFTGQLPSPDEFMREYRSLKSQVKGPFRVDYVLIGPGQPSVQFSDSGLTIGEVVERQGIRRALLETFNGDPAEGRHDVSDVASLTEATRDIVARSASTDRAALDRFLQRGGGGITIESPLSISRIITIAATESEAAPGSPRTEGLPVRDLYKLSSRMLEGDQAGAWRNARLKGEAVHMVLSPPLPAGRHFLPFSGDASDALVLLETPATLDLFFAGEDGARMQPGADGVVLIAEGAKVKLFADVLDDVGGRIGRVPISRFNGEADLRFTEEVQGASARLQTQIDAAKDAAYADFPTVGRREGRASAVLSVHGLDAFSLPVAYRIVEGSASVSVRFVPDPGCAAGCDGRTIEKTVAIGDTDTLAGYLEVTAEAAAGGRIRVKLGGDDAIGFPGSGSAHDQSFDIEPGRAGTQTFPLHLQKPVDELILSGKRVFALSATAEGSYPLKGEARADGELRIAAPSPKLVLRSHSQDPLGAGPLRLDLGGIENGGAFLDFELSDIVGDAAEGTFDVSGMSGLAFEPDEQQARSPEGNTLLRLRPTTTFLCACFLYFDQGSREIQVRWRDAGGRQTAAAAARVEIGIPLVWQALAACGRLVLLALLAAYILWGIVKAMRARVFPPGSGIDIVYQREDPRFLQFPSGFSAKLLAFLFPFGNRDQQARVEGLSLQASSGGALVLIRDSDKSFRFDFVGQTLQELADANPKQQGYRMAWNEKAESRSGGRRVLSLLRKPSDRY